MLKNCNGNNMKFTVPNELSHTHTSWLCVWVHFFLVVPSSDCQYVSQLLVAVTKYLRQIT
jgi:hypothetical protein